jgi:hypothetical protein
MPFYLDGCDDQNLDGNAPKMVALAVVQSYNPRRKVPRSEISLVHLESCLSKAAFSAAQNSGNMLPHLSISIFYYST